MELKEFGMFLANKREESGFDSQRQLALASKVSNGTIARIEAGTQKASPETLKKLAPFLKGVEYEDLLKMAGYLETDSDNEKMKPGVVNDDAIIPKGTTVRYGAYDEILEEDTRLSTIKENLKNQYPVTEYGEYVYLEDLGVLSPMIKAKKKGALVEGKDEKDIAKQMNKIKEDLTKGDGLSFNGEPLSEEAIESLLEAMEYAVRQTQRINKKYIPKKYRDSNEL